MTPSSQTLLPNTSNNDEQQMRDDQDEVIGRMDEDNDIPTINVDQTVNKMDDDNSESASAVEEQLPTTKPVNDESSASLITRVISAPTMPIAISRNIDIPGKHDSTTSLSVMETGSLGRESFRLRRFNFYSKFLGAGSMSPVTASSVDKKKRNRCTWPTCNKKLGLTGKNN